MSRVKCLLLPLCESSFRRTGSSGEVPSPVGHLVPVGLRPQCTSTRVSPRKYQLRSPGLYAERGNAGTRRPRRIVSQGAGPQCGTGSRLRVPTTGNDGKCRRSRASRGSRVCRRKRSTPDAERQMFCEDPRGSGGTSGTQKVVTPLLRSLQCYRVRRSTVLRVGQQGRGSGPETTEALPSAPPK